MTLYIVLRVLWFPLDALAMLTGHVLGLLLLLLPIELHNPALWTVGYWHYHRWAWARRLNVMADHVSFDGVSGRIVARYYGKLGGGNESVDIPRWVRPLLRFVPIPGGR